MAWIALLIAGLFEIAWAIGLKYSNGFSKFYPSIFTIVCMLISFGLLSYSMKTLPVGTAYAVWTGIGAFGTVILGMFLLGESREILRLFFLGLILIGIVGLKFFVK